ncbi:LptF/LptG family permease [Helicobacter turcicus]|uniref:LptF/LptG family permease n=1 Tax=Helicobacter turcicus TaxID=2867412 RepID=A0ABS7JL58_9HELI|nr:LptF/LptG family permease [Helicobacter turcicus]MBX7490128.1 LptF/LptG family permease [Helicobacter turcicus]MBX7544987.1 LptF/LptG family permease [Helicobacter turcicus]
MSLFFRYISFLYLKYLFFLFVSLECFFVAIDLIKFLDSLPSSANLFILLLVYDFMYASQFILPLSLILAQIVLMINLLRSAQFTAFLALGYARVKIFYPIFLLSFLITLLFIALNATPFAYAKERVDLIINQGFVGNYKSDLFVKYNQNYIYFKKIYPLLQSAEGVVVYEFDSTKNMLTSIVESKKAQFNGRDWILENVTITTLDDTLEFSKNPLKVQKESTYKTLHDFKPKILENIYEKQGNISILDAFEALILLKMQNASTQKVRGALYNLLFFPFFAPLIMICLSIFIPNSNRYANFSLMTLGMVLGILITWGIFFSFSKLSISGFLQPEFSVLIPIFTLFLASNFCLYKILKT